jgi:HEAT repeat protein/beta-lactamase regulating signal transducer with metallopeptidase domain
VTLDRFLISAAGSTAFTFLIEIALKGTLLLILAAMLVLALRRGSAAYRHLVWACALAGLVALPIMLAALPAWRVSAPALAWLAPTSHSVETTGEAEVVSPASPSDAATPAPEPQQPSLEPAAPTHRETRTILAPAPDKAPIPWPAVALMLWAIGALAVLFWFMAGHARLRMFAGGARPVRDGEWHALALEAADRLGLTLPFALLRADDVIVPVAFGLFRPRVLLPAGSDVWPVEMRRAVLLHELAHVQRHDCLTQAVAQLACALFWFHPGVWWAASRLQVERERACDDRVLEARTRPSEYADQLLGMVCSLRATRQAAWGAVAFARRSSLEGRLLAVLDPFRDRRAVRLRVVAPAALLAALLIPPFAAFEPVAASSPRGESTYAKRPSTSDPKALGPSRLVRVPEPGQSLEQRAAWARSDAGRSRESVWWIGWLIETSPRDGNMLSDSEGISLDLLGERGAFTLEDVLAGREQGTSKPDDHAATGDAGRKHAAMLVRMSGGVPDRVRVQSPGLPVEFWGGALYWLDAVSEDQSFAWLRDAAERARDERMRGQLVESISFMRNSQLVAPYLMARFKSAGSAEVRAHAAEGLARHPSPEAVRLLAGAARTDRSQDVRRACVEALGQFQTPEALDALLAIAKVSEGPEVRRAAYDALGQKVSRLAPDGGAPDGKGPPDDEVVAVDKASDPQQLGEPQDSGPPDEVSVPMPAAELEIQRQAIESLGRYPESQSLQQLWRIAETSPNGDLRAQAVESIGRLGSPAALALLDQVVWKNRQARARDAAVEAMGRHLPADAALEKLMTIARTHPSHETRRASVEMIGRLDTPSAREALDRIVAEGTDVDSQRQAVESLGRRDEAGIEQRLLEIARTHRSIDVRRQSIESLGRREGNAERLLSIAKAEGPEEVQRQAAESLGRVDDPRVKGMLMDLARSHPSIQVERQAVESLGRLEADVMGDLAQIARTHRSSEVRRQAVESMTRRDPDQALPLIEEILRKPKQKSGT